MDMYSSMKVCWGVRGLEEGRHCATVDKNRKQE